MNGNLDHQSNKLKTADLVEMLDIQCARLDQQHYLERKIKFLLDIRGYLKINQLKGSYIEFGSYKSEMQYCAYKILNSTNMITKYIGLDTFEGEPVLSSDDSASMPSLIKGSFKSDFNSVKNFIKENIGERSVLIRGDFRNDTIIEKCSKFEKPVVVVIDCNLLTSIDASLKYAIKNICSGGILFLDEYYTNFGEGQARIKKSLHEKINNYNCELVDHGFYPPFAKSFIIVKSG